MSLFFKICPAKITDGKDTPIAQQKLLDLSVPKIHIVPMTASPNGTMVIKKEKEPCPMHGQNERQTEAVGHMSHTCDCKSLVKLKPVCEDNNQVNLEGKEKTRGKSNGHLLGEKDSDGVMITCPKVTRGARGRRSTMRYDEASDDNYDVISKKRRQQKRKSHSQKNGSKDV